MSEEIKTQGIAKPDLDQFCAVLERYIEYCIQSPKNKVDKKEKSSTSASEREKNEAELKASAKKCNEQYKVLCEEIAQGGISFLSTYVYALKKLYEEKKEWKKDIKTVLVGAKSLALFCEARKNILDLYPILFVVNETFPVDEYTELSLSPKAALYGKEVNKTANGSTKRAPMKNEEIQAMLKLFLQVKDYKRFGDWIIAILVFAPDQLLEVYRDEYLNSRKELISWAYDQINTNDAYKRAAMDALLKNKTLNVFIDAFVAQPVLSAKQSELEKRIKELEEEIAKEKADFEERRAKQYAMIQERDANIDALRQKAKDFERCKQQLTSYIEKYQTQVCMNERITADNERRIQEVETACDRMQNELRDTKNQLENLQISHAALEADYSLKNNELQRLKEMASQKEETAKVDLMRELVAGINEQFFYLTMFYLELKDTGKLEPESIELYADTLNNIDSALADMGIKKIGVIDQKVSYDASIHISTDAKISNGEQVIVSGYGWKIGDEIYIKAPVEKGE